MDMRQLKYFVQIVESGSLAKASRQLYIAQPALSQQMTRLEGEVGKTLLTRSAKGVAPTENGLALYHHAVFMLRQLDQALAIARQDSSPLSGRVSLGLAPTTVCALGLPLMRHLRASYPGVVLNVVEGLSGHLEHMTRQGQLDVAVLFSQNAAHDLTVEPLLDETLFVLLPKVSTLVAPDRLSVTLEEVSRLPLILPSGGHGLRRRISLEFERIGITIEPVAEIDSLPLLLASVMDGIGVTIKPTSAAFAHGVLHDGWRCLSISDAAMTRPNFLYSLPAAKLSPCAALVRDELKAVVRRLVSSGDWTGVTLHGCDTVPNAALISAEA